MNNTTISLEKLQQTVNNYIRKRAGVKDGEYFPIYVNYCTYKQDSSGNIINNLNEIPIKGKYKVVRGYDEMYDRNYTDNEWVKNLEKKGEDYTSEELDSPTWLELTWYANEAILTTQDFYHKYLEDIYINDDGEHLFALGS